MFSSLSNQKVAYFGLWAEETRPQSMAVEALTILKRCVDNCTEQDVYTDEVEEVLQWVSARSLRQNPVDRFRMSLTIQDPEQREQIMRDSYVRIARELGLFNGRL